MKNKYICELEPGVFLADWEGDPGRTLKKENARKYNSKRAALKAIKIARSFRPFLNADVLEVDK